MNPLARVGLIGIAIFIGINAFAVLVLAKPAAQPFSDDWWSQWFPSVVVFLVLLAAGIVLSRRKRPSDSNGLR